MYTLEGKIQNQRRKLWMKVYSNKAKLYTDHYVCKSAADKAIENFDITFLKIL